MALIDLTPDQLAHSFNLQKNVAQQEKYKREGEMMTAEEKRAATMINTASGRTALRGLGNKFGPLTLQVNEERKIYDQFNKVMKGQQIKKVEGVKKKLMETEHQIKQRKRSGESGSGSGGKLQRTLYEQEEEDIPTKVFAKIRGFPFWPAEVMEIDEDGRGRVRFQDGQVGVDATLVDFSQENLLKFLNEGFKKKLKLKQLFLEETKNWGLCVIE